MTASAFFSTDFIFVELTMFSLLILKNMWLSNYIQFIQSSALLYIWWTCFFFSNSVYSYIRIICWHHWLVYNIGIRFYKTQSIVSYITHTSSTQSSLCTPQKSSVLINMILWFLSLFLIYLGKFEDAYPAPSGCLSFYCNEEICADQNLNQSNLNHFLRIQVNWMELHLRRGNCTKPTKMIWILSIQSSFI